MQCFDAHVRSRMTYACQIWNVSVAQKRRLDAAHMRLLRQMVRNGNKKVSQTDHRPVLTNIKVLALTQTQPITEFIEKRQLQFTGHTIRQPNYRHTKQLMFNRDPGKLGGNHLPTLLTQAMTYIPHYSTDQFLTAARNREF